MTDVTPAIEDTDEEDEEDDEDDEDDKEDLPGILRLAFTLGRSIGSRLARLALLLLEDALFPPFPPVTKDEAFNPCSCPAAFRLQAVTEACEAVGQF